MALSLVATLPHPEFQALNFQLALLAMLYLTQLA
jgi:hypothetical protein